MKHAVIFFLALMLLAPACKRYDNYHQGVAVIAEFTASASVTPVYAPVILTWDVLGADMVILTDVGLVPAAGSRTVNPQQTTTYTLMAEGTDDIKVSKSLTVKVDREPACASIRIVEYSYQGSGDMRVKVGPNASKFYAAVNVAVRWTLYDSKGKVLRSYDAVIPKIMPGEYGNIVINGRVTSFASSTVELIGCECPLIEP
jgi:hypothetical protein